MLKDKEIRETLVEMTGKDYLEQGLVYADLVEAVFRTSGKEATVKDLLRNIQAATVLCESASLVFNYRDGSSTHLIYAEEANAVLVKTYTGKDAGYEEDEKEEEGGEA